MKRATIILGSPRKSGSTSILTAEAGRDDKTDKDLSDDLLRSISLELSGCIVPVLDSALHVIALDPIPRRYAGVADGIAP